MVRSQRKDDMGERVVNGQLFMQFSELANEQQQYWVDNTLWKSIPLESVFKLYFWWLKNLRYFR